MNLSLIKNASLSIAVSLALVGCFGSSSSNVENNPISTNTFSLTGVSSKGIFKQATVKAYELNDQGDKVNDTVVAETTTDDNGEYTLKVDEKYQGKALLVELSVNSNTTFICDALEGCGDKAYGEDVKPESAFAMSSLVKTSVGQGTITGHITPFSHMAAKNAQTRMKSGADASNALLQANSELAQLLGVNIATITPVDITKSTGAPSEDEQMLALQLAAFADIAFTGSGGLKATLDNYSANFADGQFESAAGEKPAEITQLLDNLKKQLQSDKPKGIASDTKKKLEEQIEIVDNSSVGGFNPEPTPVENLSEIQRAKQLVQETRNWITSFDTLNNPTDVFLSEAQKANELITDNSEKAVEVLYYSLSAVVNAIDKGRDSGQYPSKVTVTNDNNVILGELNITVNSNDSAINVNANSVVGGIQGVAVQFFTGLDTSLNSLDDNESLKGKTLKLNVGGKVSDANVVLELPTANNNQNIATLVLSDKINADNDVEPLTLTLEGKISVQGRNSGVETGDTLTGDVRWVVENANQYNTPSENFSGVVPREIKLENMLIKTADSGELNDFTIKLTIEDPEKLLRDESDTNFAIGTFMFATDMALKGQPEAKIAITLDRKAQHTAKLSGKIAYQQQVLDLDLTAIQEGDDGKTTGALDVSNAAGVKMTFNSEDGSTGSIKVDGKSVAKIDNVANRGLIIRYNDGTFESLI